MSGVARSALNPEPQSLALPVLLAVILHVGAATTLACASFLAGPSKPMIDKNDAMEVSMMVLPRSKSSMPERAQRAPRTAGEQQPAPKEAVEPPPKESDLVKFEKDAPAKKEGQEADLAKKRQKALLDMLEDDENAAEGATDRDASDPNSTSDEAINTGAAGSGDPELGKYLGQLTKLFNQNFRPLPAIVAANPDLRAEIRVLVDETGKVTSYEWVKESGNPSFDASAESAVQAVSSIPLPPEKYRDRMAGGYVIVFQK